VFTVSVVVLPGVVEVGTNEQVASIAAGVWQVKLTVPVKPLMALSPIVVVPGTPRETVNGFGVAAKLKSGVPLEMVTVRGALTEAE